jgi:hypothetical protein
MLRPLLAPVLLLTAFSLACATPQTRVAASGNPAVNIRELRTFAFAPADRMDMSGSQMADPVTRQRIEAVIARELQAKGLVQVPFESAPNLLVSYFADVYEGPVEGSQQMNNWERQGKITIEVIDAKAMQVLWRGDGWALNPQPRVAEQVVVDVLAKFP